MRPVSVVIPSIKDEVLTLQSLPEEVDTNVVREGTECEACNIGVERASHDRIIRLDDDISFSESFFWELVDRIERGTLLGYPDWDYGLVAGRVMAFHRNDWERFGGFDETLGSHMGDTEFALKFVHYGDSEERSSSGSRTARDGVPRAGRSEAPRATGRRPVTAGQRGTKFLKQPGQAWRRSPATQPGDGVERIDPDEIEHEPHERSVTTWDRAWRTAYLAAKYPYWARRIVTRTIA